jgi:hypothetical protein
MAVSFMLLTAAATHWLVHRRLVYGPTWLHRPLKRSAQMPVGQSNGTGDGATSPVGPIGHVQLSG